MSLLLYNKRLVRLDSDDAAWEIFDHSYNHSSYGTSTDNAQVYFLDLDDRDKEFPRFLKGKTTGRRITVYDEEQYFQHMIVDGWEDITDTIRKLEDDN